jgi:hypothetical protein
MSAPVYYIVFHEGHWRIKYEGLYLGEFPTAAAAAESATEVARSRLETTPSPQIVIDPIKE